MTVYTWCRGEKKVVPAISELQNSRKKFTPKLWLLPKVSQLHKNIQKLMTAIKQQKSNEQQHIKSWITTTPLVFELHKRRDTKISYHTVRHPYSITPYVLHMVINKLLQ